MLPEITSHQQRLDNLFKKMSTFSSDIEMGSHWSRYLCVLVSGFLEVAIYEIYADYADRTSAPNIAKYVGERLDDFQNPRMQKILELVGSFSENWRREIEQHASFEEMKDAINSVVNNRNRIAHGENVGISYHNLREYYKHVVRLIGILYSQCNP